MHTAVDLFIKYFHLFKKKKAQQVIQDIKLEMAVLLWWKYSSGNSHHECSELQAPPPNASSLYYLCRNAFLWAKHTSAT